MTAATETTDQVAVYSDEAAHLLRQAEKVLFHPDNRADQYIAAAGVWAQLAQVAALAVRPAIEDVTH